MRNQFLDQGKKINVGERMTDAFWDSFLPKNFQTLSPFQWTPISVVERTWEYLQTDMPESIVDLGSGVGKFCIYLSLLSKAAIRIAGVEDRKDLVLVSESLKEHWNTPKVEFQNINFLKQFPYGHSHYYCFNPLYETMKGIHSIDTQKEKSANQFLKDLQTLKQNLLLLKPKTKLITFHGFGGNYLPGFRVIIKEEIAGGEYIVWERE